jgi:hypothetical protein
MGSFSHDPHNRQPGRIGGRIAASVGVERRRAPNGNFHLARPGGYRLAPRHRAIRLGLTATNSAACGRGSGARERNRGGSPPSRRPRLRPAMSASRRLRSFDCLGRTLRSGRANHHDGGQSPPMPRALWSARRQLTRNSKSPNSQILGRPPPPLNGPATSLFGGDYSPYR